MLELIKAFLNRDFFCLLNFHSIILNLFKKNIQENPEIFQDRNISGNPEIFQDRNISGNPEIFQDINISGNPEIFLS